MKVFVTAVAAFGLLTAAPVFAGEDLAKEKNCMACHAVDRQMVGPAYSDIAEKYKGDDGAMAAVVDQIQNGGSGEWGPVPMPPQPQVDDEQAKALAEWILGL